MVSPEEQSPDHVLRALAPALHMVQVGLEHGVDEAVRYDRDRAGDDGPLNPYLLPNLVRYNAALYFERESTRVDGLSFRRGSNNSLKFAHRLGYDLLALKADELPTPRSQARASYYEQPLIGMEVERLRLLVLWDLEGLHLGKLRLVCPRTGSRTAAETSAAWDAAVFDAAENFGFTPPAIDVVEPDDLDIEFADDPAAHTDAGDASA